MFALPTPASAGASRRTGAAQSRDTGDDGASSDSSSGADSDGYNTFMHATHRASDQPAVEEDALEACARRLASHLRSRPTLPARPDNPSQSILEVDIPIRLPLFSCPFSGCSFRTDDAELYDMHIASRRPADPLHIIIAETCSPHIALLDAKQTHSRDLALGAKE